MDVITSALCFSQLRLVKIRLPHLWSAVAQYAPLELFICESAAPRLNRCRRSHQLQFFEQGHLPSFACLDAQWSLPITQYSLRAQLPASEPLCQSADYVDMSAPTALPLIAAPLMDPTQLSIARVKACLLLQEYFEGLAADRHYRHRDPHLDRLLLRDKTRTIMTASGFSSRMHKCMGSRIRSFRRS